MPEKLLTTDEAIKRLNISRPTLYEWMGRGIIKPVDMYPAQFKRRPKLMFRESDVNRLMPAEHVEVDEEEPSPRNKSKTAA